MMTIYSIFVSDAISNSRGKRPNSLITSHPQTLTSSFISGIELAGAVYFWFVKGASRVTEVISEFCILYNRKELTDLTDDVNQIADR